MQFVSAIGLLLHNYIFVSGLNGGKDSDNLKGYPFIPIVTAPKISLLVRSKEKLEKGVEMRVQLLISTFQSAWPMLIFVVVSACLAGIVMWLLVSLFNLPQSYAWLYNFFARSVKFVKIYNYYQIVWGHKSKYSLP